MKFVRALLQLLQTVAPPAAAWLAERLFFTPRRSALSPAGNAFLATGRRFTAQVHGRRVAAWRWGSDGAPIVYLVHGWGSRGARLAAFAPPLLDAGFAVVTYDAVGHGQSGHGMSSMPEFARTLGAVVSHVGAGARPHAIIAHSFGASGTALAASWGLSAERLVFLAPAADPPTWVEPFTKLLGLRPETVERVRARSERRIGCRWADMNVCEIAGALSRPPRPPLLVVHDENDETVAFQDGVAIAAAWPGARLLSTRGLGHRGVTNDPRMVDAVMAFVRGDGPAPRALSEEAALEYELFYREERATSYRYSTYERTAPSMP